jgi:hypothetical protein
LKVEAASNPPHQLSFDAFPFGYYKTIGDTARLREHWTSIIDTIVDQTKGIDPADPPPVYVTSLQSWGSCSLNSEQTYRITIPEEVKELANLAVLHEAKGILHFTLHSFRQGRDCFANLWDDYMVP